MLRHFKIHISAHTNLPNHILTGEVPKKRKEIVLSTSFCILLLLIGFPVDFRCP
jgi:hypothetical protein